MSNETVAKYLAEVLEACRDDDADEARLMNHVPRIDGIHPFGISTVLLEFSIAKITQLPTPIFDPTLPPENRTKPVRQLFEAVVNVVLCDRPKYRTTLAEIRRFQPGRRSEMVVYECKEFEDGQWIFLDAELTR